MTAQLDRLLAVVVDGRVDHRERLRDLHHFKGRDLAASISTRGTPIQVGRRWVVEAANSWRNDFAKLRRCTERTELAVQAYVDLAMAVVTLRALLRRAWKQYRWEGQPRSARIR